MHRLVAAPFLLLSLAAAPAWAGDKLTMQVSATILPRNTCALSADAGMRCSGTDPQVLYRVSHAGAPARPVLGRATRGKPQALKTASRGEVLTIEF